MALTTKGTWEEGLFDAGSRSHFTVGTTDLSTAQLYEDFIKTVQTVATIVEVGARSTSTRFSVENNGITAAELQTLVQAATGHGSTTVSTFAY